MILTLLEETTSFRFSRVWAQRVKVSLDRSNVLPSAAFLPGLCPFPAPSLLAALPAMRPATATPASEAPRPRGRALLSPKPPLSRSPGVGAGGCPTSLTRPHLTLQLPEHSGCDFTCACALERAVCAAGGLQGGGPCPQVPCCSCCLPEAFRCLVSFLLIL